MKKIIYTLKYMPVILALLSVQSFATIHTIQVGNFFFNPSSLPSVNTGDTVRWVWVGGTHTTTSSTIPSGAAAWDEPITSSNTTYDYVPVITGLYNYVCTPHVGMGMIGSFTVVSAPAPLSVIASSDDDNLCGGQSTWLHATPSGGTGTYSYSWVSNPPGFTSNQKDVQITPSLTRQYTVTVTSGSQNASSSVSVAVTLPPVANAGSDSEYCANIEQIRVTGTATNSGTVLWTSSGDGTFTDPTSLVTFYTPGVTDRTQSSLNLVLTASAVAPCTTADRDTVHIILDPCTGVDEKTSAGSLTVYPNPSSGKFTISGYHTGGEFLFYDISGNIILRQAAAGTKQSFEINRTGIIGIRYVSGEKVLSGKVVITGR